MLVSFSYMWHYSVKPLYYKLIQVLLHQKIRWSFTWHYTLNPLYNTFLCFLSFSPSLGNLMETMRMADVCRDQVLRQCCPPGYVSYNGQYCRPENCTVCACDGQRQMVSVSFADPCMLKGSFTVSVSSALTMTLNLQFSQPCFCWAYGRVKD